MAGKSRKPAKKKATAAVRTRGARKGSAKRRNSITGDLKKAGKKLMSAAKKSVKKIGRNPIDLRALYKEAVKLDKAGDKKFKEASAAHNKLWAAADGSAEAKRWNAEWQRLEAEGTELKRKAGLKFETFEREKARRQNPRRRNKAPHISEADISKLSPQAQAQLRAQLGKVETQEARATTPAQKKAAAKSRRSFLARLGTRLRVVGQTKKYKVSARDLNRCPRRTVKVRGRHETDALTRGSAIRKIKKQVKGPKDAYRYRVEKNPKKRRRNSAESNRQAFAGNVTGYKELYFPAGAPQGLSTLGPLELIRTEAGDLRPTAGAAYLCEDEKHRLWIGTSKPNAVLYDGPAQSFGKVTRVEYRCRKPHLGYPDQVTWFHDFEDPLPTLKADGHGGLHIVGGGYGIKREGIVG